MEQESQSCVTLIVNPGYRFSREKAQVSNNTTEYVSASVPSSKNKVFFYAKVEIFRYITKPGQEILMPWKRGSGHLNLEVVDK